MRRPSGAVWLVLPLAFALAATRCSGDRPTLAEPDAAAAQGNAPLPAAKMAVVERRGVDAAVVATAVVPVLAVYGEPDAPEPVATLPNPRPAGGPLVVVVAHAEGSWLEVVLPTAPVGATGWVRAADVTVARHNYRIDVLLSDFRLDVYLYGDLVRRIPVGVGPAAPVAGGRYYTMELLQPPAIDAVFGTMLYALSGAADGSIWGIHATDEPSSVGGAGATGSIALRNQDLEDLASFLPLGVPVNVVA